MLRLISLIILILLLAAPVFGLSLQEQMDLIKQQEQARRAQIQQKHDADKPKPAPVVRTQKFTPVQPEAKVAETREPEPALVSDVPSLQQVTPVEKDVPTTTSPGLMADQLWQGQRGTVSHVTQFRLFIDAVTDEEVSAILQTIYRGEKQLYVVKGSYDRANGKIDLRTVDRLSARASQPPQQITGKLSGGKQVLNTIFHYPQNSPEIELKLIAGADDEIRDVLEPARKTLQAKAEQQRQRDYYQALVITPELDEYGLKTLETVKLEREKQLLRPLSAEEYERVKTDHQQQVSRAIAQRQQQLEAERAHKAQMEAREKEALAQRQQQLEAERVLKAQIAAREKEPLLLFDTFNMADDKIDRKKLRAGVARAGGTYLTPEVMVLNYLAEVPAHQDFFDASTMLRGAAMASATYITDDSMFGSSDYLVAFVYEFEDMDSFQLISELLEKKYGHPSSVGETFFSWKRDDGKSELQLEIDKEIPFSPTFTIAFINLKNYELFMQHVKARHKKMDRNL